ncbi:hypothetical protein KAS79_00890 [Candidatus Parcubacteria bacterium]|nr:hypothetical protein [Candidatus Parcubacteria bacterium]
MSKLYKTMLILSMIGLILPCFGFAQPTTTENEPLEAPGTLEQAKSLIIELIMAIPEGMNSAWQEAKEIWQNTWVNWWGSYIKPNIIKIENWIKNLWQDTTPMIEQEFEKEKQEIKQDLGEQGEKVKQGIWERFKQLIKDAL